MEESEKGQLIQIHTICVCLHKRGLPPSKMIPSHWDIIGSIVLICRLSFSNERSRDAYQRQAYDWQTRNDDDDADGDEYGYQSCQFSISHLKELPYLASY